MCWRGVGGAGSTPPARPLAQGRCLPGRPSAAAAQRLAGKRVVPGHWAPTLILFFLETLSFGSTSRACWVRIAGRARTEDGHVAGMYRVGLAERVRARSRGGMPFGSGRPSCAGSAGRRAPAM